MKASRTLRAVEMGVVSLVLISLEVCFIVAFAPSAIPDIVGLFGTIAGAVGALCGAGSWAVGVRHVGAKERSSHHVTDGDGNDGGDGSGG